MSTRRLGYRYSFEPFLNFPQGPGTLAYVGAFIAYTRRQIRTES